MTFEIKERDAAARICRFQTKHGTVTTPNLLPVINPNNMVITPKEMKKLFGIEILITNSYIINKNKQLREKAVTHGVHKLIDFDGTIMTDSGTFQSYVYGDINIDPIEIVTFQKEIGSDIGTILDIFSTPDQTKKQAEQSVDETIKRAKKSIQYKGDMLLACTVQGSIYPHLRKKCAQQLSTIDADFFPIGGVVPLMENQRYTDLISCILASKKGLNPSKPVHLFGAGHPLIFPLAVALGCDFFDSSAYIKYANDNRMIFSWGTERLDDVSELPCCCPICSKTSASELKTLEKKEAIVLIAKHNLYVSFAEIKKIRTAIHQGSLWELVERRAYHNPYLLESLKQLRTKENKNWLNQFEPLSKKKALFYTGSHTIHRPLIHRLHTRIKNRYVKNSETTIVLPEGKKPYSTYYSKQIDVLLRNENSNIIVDSPLGPIPIELDDMYPIAQSVIPQDIDSETKKIAKKLLTNYLKKQRTIYWDNKEKIIPSKDTDKTSALDMHKISAVADIQFGKHASQALFTGDIKLIKSKNTGKIRNILCNNNHILSLRASDGFFTLKLEGGKMLHSFFKPPQLRVVVHHDTVPFIKDGKSVFAKFVVECDPELVPLDECLIVDESDVLIGVGRCLLNRIEMLSFTHGLAVKTREYIP
ncbi:MAG: tRNA guanosine(15) transglycosylase TgtA [Thermoplasmatota archaeon]